MATEPLTDPADHVQAATALRALIENVVVRPTFKRSQADIKLSVTLRFWPAPRLA